MLRKYLPCLHNGIGFDSKLLTATLICQASLWQSLKRVSGCRYGCAFSRVGRRGRGNVKSRTISTSVKDNTQQSAILMKPLIKQSEFPSHQISGYTTQVQIMLPTMAVSKKECSIDKLDMKGNSSSYTESLKASLYWMLKKRSTK